MFTYMKISANLGDTIFVNVHAYKPIIQQSNRASYVMEYQIRRWEHGYGKWFLIDDNPDSTPNEFPNNRMEREFVMTPISGILKGVKIVCIKL